MDQMDPNTDTKAKQGWTLGILQLVFVVGVIAAAIGLTQILKAQVSERAPQISDLRGDAEITVRLADVRTLTYAPTLRVNGTVQATAEVAVSPQVSGEIRTVSPAFRAGSEIARGDLLFEIDRADYVLAVQRAESEIAAASSDLMQLEAEAAIAVQEWKELYPGRDVNPLAARLPQIDAAKARLASAQANKRGAELSLQRTRVYAPTSARVLASSLDVGQIVSPGQTVGRLVSLESIELAVPVSLENLSFLDPVVGREAMYQRRINASEPRSAIVSRIDGSLDPRTRLSNLYLAPADRAGLRIGDFVDVSIAGDPVENAMVIPATALSGQATLWVVSEGELDLRRVTLLGETEDGRDVFVAPFDSADGIVALPPLEAEIGQRVGVRASPLSPAANTGVSDGAQ